MKIITKELNEFENKILGALYGFAIGDSMGATTEFMIPEMIVNEYGCVDDLIGGGWLNLKPGEVTDDTQMMICVIDALIECKKNVNRINPNRFKRECMENFKKWYDTIPKDVGNQCARAINFYAKTKSYIGEDFSACGNGSLMRALPCALMNLPSMNTLQGRLTHNNSICSGIIWSYTNMIQSLLRNDGIVKSVAFSDSSPTGYVIDTFECVKRHFRKARDFKEGIIMAVNEGGDADTIAAITGGLLGAKFGYREIPVKWILKLDENVGNKLNEFANFIFEEVKTK